MGLSPNSLRIPSGAGSTRFQSGQAVILILLLTVAVVLVGLSLLNTGILASEKMQLQNAADATAYSVSTIEARDLNFAAYTNRSMIANEVALGQMVGLMSHADMISSLPGWWGVYFSQFYPVPVVGQILAVIGNTVLGIPAPIPKAIVRAVGPPISAFIYEFNKWISASQRIFNLGSLAFTGATLFKIPALNADNAQYSPFGYLSMGFHLLSHYPDFTPRKVFREGPFISSYRQDNERRKFPDVRPLLGGQFSDKATTDTQKRGVERLAALVNASRDPYSLHRHCGPDPSPLWKFNCVNPNEPLKRPDGVDPTGGIEKFKLFLPIPAIKIRTPPPLVIDFEFDFGLDRHGGTDLRYKVDRRDKTQRYVWSATDQLAMAAKLELAVKACVPNPFGGWICADLFPPVKQNFNSPLGTGGAQSSVFKNQFVGLPLFIPLDKTMFLDGFPPGGRVKDHSYGGNPGLLTAAWIMQTAPPLPWHMIPPVGDPRAKSPAIAVQMNNLYKKYEGLSRYNDSKRGPDPVRIDKNLSFGWNSPYFLVSLEKDMGDVRQSNDVLQTQGPNNRFRLDPNTANDKLTVLANSEVYFSRPSDLSYFRRKDGRTELANAFNPYWDARLVDTSYLDRITALAINQRQLWLAQDFTAVLTGLQDLFRAILK